MRSWRDDEVFAKLRRARRIALFLDFDGTLARFCPTPAEVRLELAVRQSLYLLAHSPRVFVWIVSGRRLADVRARVGVPGIRYLGLHGWESGSNSTLSERSRVALDRVRCVVEKSCRGVPGVWVENKQFSFAVHHPRGSASAVEHILRPAVCAHRNQLRMAPARNVWEVLPLELKDKGSAVKAQLRAVCQTAMPVYVGDDLIDEPAFIVLRRGITVLVGKARRTRAKYRLAGVPEVGTFLKRLETEFA